MPLGITEQSVEQTLTIEHLRNCQPEELCLLIKHYHKAYKLCLEHDLLKDWPASQRTQLEQHWLHQQYLSMPIERLLDMLRANIKHFNFCTHHPDLIERLAEHLPALSEYWAAKTTIDKAMRRPALFYHELLEFSTAVQTVPLPDEPATGHRAICLLDDIDSHWVTTCAIHHAQAIMASEATTPLADDVNVGEEQSLCSQEAYFESLRTTEPTTAADTNIAVWADRLTPLLFNGRQLCQLIDAIPYYAKKLKTLLGYIFSAFKQQGLQEKDSKLTNWLLTTIPALYEQHPTWLQTYLTESSDFLDTFVKHVLSRVSREICLSEAEVALIKRINSDITLINKLSPDRVYGLMCRFELAAITVFENVQRQIRESGLEGEDAIKETTLMRCCMHGDSTNDHEMLLQTRLSQLCTIHGPRCATHFLLSPVTGYWVAARGNEKLRALVEKKITDALSNNEQSIGFLVYLYWLLDACYESPYMTSLQTLCQPHLPDTDSDIAVSRENIVRHLKFKLVEWHARIPATPAEAEAVATLIYHHDAPFQPHAGEYKYSDSSSDAFQWMAVWAQSEDRDALERLLQALNDIRLNFGPCDDITHIINIIEGRALTPRAHFYMGRLLALDIGCNRLPCDNLDKATAHFQLATDSFTDEEASETQAHVMQHLKSKFEAVCSMAASAAPLHAEAVVNFIQTHYTPFQCGATGYEYTDETNNTFRWMRVWARSTTPETLERLLKPLIEIRVNFGSCPDIADILRTIGEKTLTPRGHFYIAKLMVLDISRQTPTAVLEKVAMHYGLADGGYTDQEGTEYPNQQYVIDLLSDRYDSAERVSMSTVITDTGTRSSVVSMPIRRAGDDSRGPAEFQPSSYPQTRRQPPL